MLLLAKKKSNKKISYYNYFHLTKLNNKINKSKNYLYLDYEINKSYKNDYKNFKFLNSSFKIFLKLLTESLNKIHNENESSNYWNAIVGEWLHNFLEEAYSHWSKLSLFLNKCEVLSCEEYKLGNLIPFNSADFHSLRFYFPWKNWLVNECLKYKIGKNLKFLLNKKLKEKRNKQNFLLINKYFFLGNTKKIFLYNSEIKIKKTIKIFFEFKFLQLYLGKKRVFLKSEINLKKRNNLIIGKFNNKFNDFIKNIIPYCLPINYLENYKDYKVISSKVNWPSKPNYILTSYPYHDDIFKFYYANLLKHRSKLMILQHGGIQSQKIKFKLNKLQLNHYKNLTWGKKFFSKGDSVLSFTKTDRSMNKFNFKYNKKLRNLILLYCWNESYSTPYGIGFDQYIRNKSIIDNTKKFIFSMNKSFQLQTDIKILNLNSKNIIKKELSKDLPFIKHVNESLLLQDIMGNYKLFVHFSFITPFFECIYFNKPSILIVDPKIMFWEPDRDLKNLINKYNGLIFFKTYKKAVNFINNTSIEVWWNSKKVQEMRNFFCKVYCNDANHFMNNLKKIII